MLLLFLACAHETALDGSEPTVQVDQHVWQGHAELDVVWVVDTSASMDVHLDVIEQAARSVDVALADAGIEGSTRYQPADPELGDVDVFADLPASEAEAGLAAADAWLRDAKRPTWVILASDSDDLTPTDPAWLGVDAVAVSAIVAITDECDAEGIGARYALAADDVHDLCGDVDLTAHSLLARPEFALSATAEDVAVYLDDQPIDAWDLTPDGTRVNLHEAPEPGQTVQIVYTRL